MFATFNPNARSQNPVSFRFRKPLSSTDMVSLKTNIETTYSVALLYSGEEFDYDVTLIGSASEFVRAMNTLFPKDRDDIVIQRSQF